MFHDKLKMLGTLVGAVFAVVLSNQQAGTFMGLIYKNISGSSSRLRADLDRATGDGAVSSRADSLDRGAVAGARTPKKKKGAVGRAWSVVPRLPVVPRSPRLTAVRNR